MQTCLRRRLPAAISLLNAVRSLIRDELTNVSSWTAGIDCPLAEGPIGDLLKEGRWPIVPPDGFYAEIAEILYTIPDRPAMVRLVQIAALTVLVFQDSPCPDWNFDAFYSWQQLLEPTVDLNSQDSEFVALLEKFCGEYSSVGSGFEFEYPETIVAAAMGLLILRMILDVSIFQIRESAIAVIELDQLVREAENGRRGCPLISNHHPFFLGLPRRPTRRVSEFWVNFFCTGVKRASFSRLIFEVRLIGDALEDALLALRQ